MNNTAKQSENKELKPYVPKTPLVPEESLMSEAEIKEFVRSMLMESDYEHYALDGFIFLFKTFGELANQAQVKAIDLCNDLQTFVYQETIHCHLSGDKYTDSVHERYRNTDYTEKNIKVYHAIQQEVGAPEDKINVLDLSNSSVEDLAKGLSDLMQNPNLPAKLHDCLGDELSDLCGGQINEPANSPEVIAKALKEKSEEKNDA